jgi:hypothetical protein
LSFVGRARVPLWLQKSVRGVGLREATLVAAGVGDGGLARKRGTVQSERASRARSPGNGWHGEGPVEGRLLVEGVLDRGNLQPSRVGGGSGLGSPDGSVLAPAPEGDRDVRATAFSGWRQLTAAPRSRGSRAKRIGWRESPGPSFLSRDESHAQLGCSSLKCGLQMSARRISDGCAPEPSGF